MYPNITRALPTRVRKYLWEKSMVDPSVVCDYKQFVLVNYVVSFDCPQRLQKYVIVNLGSSSLTMLHQTFWGETAQSLGRETKNYQGPSYILFPTIFWSFFTVEKLCL